jgi:prepilin-type N-terminal cleavage/methylation domain-containing protein
MKRRAAGFTIIEMLIALAIVSLVLAAASTFFIASVKQYKTQTKIVETNVEGILGLELLRQDVESLGFGLPWNNLNAYTERTGVSAALLALNDTGNPPRAVVSIDCAAFTVNRSDYLVIKSARVGKDNAAGKWTTLTQDTVKRPWTPNEENMVNSDYVIVLALGSGDANRRSLVVPGSAYTQFNNTDAFIPVEPYSANIVYGIKSVPPVGPPFRPFNRAEYYIANAASTPPVTVPQHCAPNTGVLVKAVVAHDGSGSIGTVSNPLLPLIDCVADLQVVYGLDNNADGTADTWTDDISALLPTAAAIRAQLAEIRIHILAQEGQRDDSYTHATNPITVGSEGAGNPFSITGYEHYRWKLYSIVVRPKNLGQ